ncbi:hypothetical protein PJM26_31000, partial [Mycobacterium kansasii]
QSLWKLHVTRPPEAPEICLKGFLAVTFDFKKPEERLVDFEVERQTRAEPRPTTLLVAIFS